MNSYDRELIQTWASDFTESIAYSRLASDEKQSAAAIIEMFLECACEFERVAPGEITEAGVSDAMLNHMPQLALPEAVRPRVPEIVRDALEYLESSGRLGDGAHLGRVAMALAGKFRERCAPGGGERLAPIVNQTTSIGRNDPCPCGSGKKYKKCCGTA